MPMGDEGGWKKVSRGLVRGMIRRNITCGPAEASGSMAVLEERHGAGFRPASSPSKSLTWLAGSFSSGSCSFVTRAGRSVGAHV